MDYLLYFYKKKPINNNTINYKITKKKEDELDYKDLQNQVAGFLQKQRKVFINI